MIDDIHVAADGTTHHQCGMYGTYKGRIQSLCVLVGTVKSRGEGEMQ